MEMIYGRRPIAKELLVPTRHFLQSLALRYDERVDFTVSISDNGRIIATGSRERNILKCIGVAAESRERGLAAKILTELIKDAIAEGFAHLFLFTRPENRSIFHDLGFYPIANTQDILLMENVRDGVTNFVAGLECPTLQGVIGCIVANCDPFTNGHLYLVETACRACDLVHLFILSENRGMFAADVRLALAKRAVARLAKVVVHPTADYLVSYTTFPDYFLHHKEQIEAAHCELDLMIFVERFAKPLQITRRFVGSEPLSPVTHLYNQALQTILPRHGIEAVVVPRMETDGMAISASRVRDLIRMGRMDEIKQLVPLTTYEYLRRQDYDVAP